jgi:hypothetical protein
VPGVQLDAPADNLDALELRDAILGDGTVLHETGDGGFVIHLVTAGRVQRLGSYVDAAAAWRALDDIDRHPEEWDLADSEAETQASLASAESQASRASAETQASLAGAGSQASRASAETQASRAGGLLA